MADTLIHALMEHAAPGSVPDAGFRFLDASERATWIDLPSLALRAQKAAGALAALGVARGDVVALILPTHPTFLDAWLGCQMLGAIPVALYPPVRLGRLDEYVFKTAAMLRVSESCLIITEPRIRRLLGQVIERQPVRLGVIDADRLAAGPAVPPVAISPNDVQMIQFSSGTTVEPKPVALTHRQTLANARVITEAILAANPPGGAIRAAGVSWLPLYHDMGLIGCVFPAILAPGPLTLIPPEVFLAKPAVWLRAISTYKGTISPAPNFAYALCTERIRDEELAGVDLSSWSLALNGAEPISPGVCRAFIERFSKIGFRPGSLLPVYGMSEMALAVAFAETGRGVRTVLLDPDALSRGKAKPTTAANAIELATVGAPLPGYAIAIRDKDRVDVPFGTVGRIWTSGPSRMQGYRDREEQPFDGPWLDTGDVGFVLNGELYITGRAKDLLVIRGRNHAPQDVESAVDVVPGVRTGCAAAVADLGADGEHLLVFVEVREAHEGQAEACADAIRSKVGVSPHLVVLLDPGTLPRTSSGKIRRAETLARWKTGMLTPPERVTPFMLAGVFAKSALGFLQAAWRRR